MQEASSVRPTLTTVAGMVMLAILGCDARSSDPVPDGAAPSGETLPISPTDPSVPGQDSLKERLEAIGYVDWSQVGSTSDSGVTRWSEAACPGLSLYNSRPRAEARLLAMNGDVVHSWSHPEHRGGWHHVELLEGGSLLAIHKDEELIRLDRDSTVVWRTKLRAHHDVAVAKDGRLFVLARRGRTVVREGDSLPVLDDLVVTLGAGGERVAETSLYDLLSDRIPQERWRAIEEFARDGSGKKGKNDSPVDVFHTNSIQQVVWPGCESGDGVLLSIREIGEIAVVRLEPPSVVWRWGRGILEGQHHATLLPDGEVLVFDNGVRRGKSRVLLVDPITGSYRVVPVKQPFFTRTRGGVERLPGGNFLITESDSGHVFEIDASGQTVWEFWNPDIRGDRRAAIYRMSRVPVDAPGVRGLLPAVEPARDR